MLTAGLAASRRRLAGDHDAGITLSELIVASTIAMILMTLATTFFVQIDRASSQTVLSNQTTADARIALDDWTTMIRVAGWLDTTTMTDRFEEITPTKVVFYANLNNRNSSDQTVAPLTKVALMLVTPTGQSDGQLVEVRFKSDNTTPQVVNRVTLNASATGSQPIFTPVNKAGITLSLPSNGCLTTSGVTTQGMCLTTVPNGAGLLDPSVAPNTSTVSQGNLRGNSSADASAALRLVGGITIDFTVSDPTHRVSMEFSGSASVNSGFPS